MSMARKQAAAAETWLCYACRTSDCAPLDRDAYPGGVYEGRPIPLPAWVCRSPDGGLHKDNRVGQIDVYLAAPPKRKDEISWTCDFGVPLISRRWLEQIEDLMDSSKTFVGRVFLKGEERTDWVTLHERSPPLLMMKEGWRKSCPICGQDNSVMYGGMFFADPAALGRKVIVSGDDIFVRKEDAEARGLKPPAGGFKPVTIRYRPEWVAQMRLREPPDFTSRA
jgi:hypothetical protein